MRRQPKIPAKYRVYVRRDVVGVGKKRRSPSSERRPLRSKAQLKPSGKRRFPLGKYRSATTGLPI